MPSASWRRQTWSAQPAAHSNLTDTISYERMPPGAVTSTTSPSDLPTSARAIGEVIEMRPARMSASSSPTIW